MDLVPTSEAKQGYTKTKLFLFELRQSFVVFLCSVLFFPLLILTLNFGEVKTVAGPVSDPSKLPKWNYDGSSTGQAPGEDSEVIL